MQIRTDGRRGGGFLFPEESCNQIKGGRHVTSTFQMKEAAGFTSAVHGSHHQACIKEGWPTGPLDAAFHQPMDGRDSRTLHSAQRQLLSHIGASILAALVALIGAVTNDLFSPALEIIIFLGNKQGKWKETNNKFRKLFYTLDTNKRRTSRTKSQSITHGCHAFHCLCRLLSHSTKS